MNILLMNYRYFVTGGPERYMFAVSELLERAGHRVVPFSFDYSRNRPTPYSKYFASSPTGRDRTLYKDLELSPRRRLKMLGKSLYNFEARAGVRKLIRTERIDVAYALQIVNTLYPAVVDACVNEGIPVVHRLSDFQFLCASYKFFRDGAICEDCIGGRHYRGVMHRCMKGSFQVSAARALGMYLDRFRRTRRSIAAFVTPSALLREKMIQGGFDAGRLHRIPTFVDARTRQPSDEPGDYFLYAGAIDPHKGVRVLLEAFAAVRRRHTLRLVLAGSSLADEETRLRKWVARRQLDGVEFRGFVDEAELARLYRGALAVIQPTLWYENIPNVVLEAMAHGKPVIASDLGGIAELIDDDRDGLLFAPADVAGLTAGLDRLAGDPALAARLGAAARAKILRENSPEVHLERLEALFRRVRQAAANTAPASRVDAVEHDE